MQRLLALPALRVKGPYLAMVTIAFGFIVEHIVIEMGALTGGQIAANRDGAIDMLAKACTTAIDEDGADQVILGGAGLAGLAERIQPRVWAPVLDSVLVGAQRAAALVRSAGPVSVERADAAPSIGVDARLASLLR